MEENLYKLTQILGHERSILLKCIRETSKKIKEDPLVISEILIHIYEKEQRFKEEQQVEEDLEELQGSEEPIFEEEYDEDFYDEDQQFEAMLRKERLIERAKEVGYKNVKEHLEELKTKGRNFDKDQLDKLSKGRQVVFKKAVKYVSTPEFYTDKYAYSIFKDLLTYVENSSDDYVLRHEFAMMFTTKDEPIETVVKVLTQASEHIAILYVIGMLIKQDRIQVSDKNQKLNDIIKILMEIGDKNLRRKVIVNFTKSTTIKGKIQEIRDIQFS
jgi:hypothetical protein